MSGTPKDKQFDKLIDWLCSDDESITTEEVEADLREAGVDIEQAKVRFRELLSRFSRSGTP